MYIQEATGLIERAVFAGNEAKQGGGLAVEESSVATVADCLFENNTAPSGAGMFVRANCTVTITGTTFNGNDINADFGNGGGVCVQDSQCDISGCEFIGNTTRGAGGGLAYISGATGTVEDCLIEGNSTEAAFNYGGGITVPAVGPDLPQPADREQHRHQQRLRRRRHRHPVHPLALVENCTIVGNSCSGDGVGGGLLVPVLRRPDRHQLPHRRLGRRGRHGLGLRRHRHHHRLRHLEQRRRRRHLRHRRRLQLLGRPPVLQRGRRQLPRGAGKPLRSGNHPDGGACGATYVRRLSRPAAARPSATCRAAGIVLGNAPNPFNPMTTLFFVLDAPGDAVIRIHDVRGHLLRTFVRSGLAADTRYEITWNGRDDSGRELPSGMYLYRLESHGNTVTKRMSLIR